MSDIASPPDAVGLISSGLGEESLPQAFAAAEARRRAARSLVGQDEPAPRPWQMVEPERPRTDRDALDDSDDQGEPTSLSARFRRAEQLRWNPAATMSPVQESEPPSEATGQASEPQAEAATMQPQAPHRDTEGVIDRLTDATAAYELAVVEEAHAEAARRAGQAEADAQVIVQGAIVEATEIRKQAAREVRAVLEAAQSFSGQAGNGHAR